MKKANVLKELERLREGLLKKLSLSISSEEKEDIASEIVGWADRARTGIDTLYNLGLGFEIGPNFSSIKKYEGLPSYTSMMRGIRRHINNCKRVGSN